ncbi:hypothetical protein D3C86_1722000 [compost metagenome]
MSPPTDNPLPDPIAAKELKTPNARFLSWFSVKVLVTIDKDDGIIKAAPSPCKARNKASTSKLGESPAPSEANIKIIPPKRNNFLRPISSESLPPIIRKPPKNNTYRVCNHCTFSAPILNCS